MGNGHLLKKIRSSGHGQTLKRAEFDQVTKNIFVDQKLSGKAIANL
jgi:hypothetical protein